MANEEFTSSSSSANSSGRHEAESGIYDCERPLPETVQRPHAGDNFSLSHLSSLSSPDKNNGVWNSPDSSSTGAASSLTISYEDKNRWETILQPNDLHSTVSLAMPISGEHDATQAAAEIQALKQQLFNEAKRNEMVHKKLSMLIVERDNIKQEMENLNSVKTSRLLSAREGSTRWDRQLELQDELDYIKGINLNLSVQLEKTQDSNSELLLEIQDLEQLLQEKGPSKEKVEDSDARKLVESLEKELAMLESKYQGLIKEKVDLLLQLKQANDKKLDKDGTFAKVEAQSSQLNKQTLVDTLTKVEVDELPDSVEGKGSEFKKAKFPPEVQSQQLLDKPKNGGYNYTNASETIEELKGTCQMLKQEQRETIQALEKQLGSTKEELSVKADKYDKVLQTMDRMQAENAQLAVEMAVLLKAKEEGDATLAQAQEIIAMLEQKLCQEEVNSSKLKWQVEEVEAKYLQVQSELNESQESMKNLEQIIMELQAARKDLEDDVLCFQGKDRVNRSQLKELELHTTALEDEIQSLKLSRTVLETEIQELKSENEKDRFGHQEENLLLLPETNMKGSQRPLEEKYNEVNDLLKKQSSDLTWQLFESDMELQELKMSQLKMNAVTSVERNIKEQRDSLAQDGISQVSYLTRSLSRVNSRVGAKFTIAPSREAKELFDLRSKVKLLEGELKRKAAELEESKEQLKEQHRQLSTQIEHLELANKEDSNSKLDQALKELSDLRSQNALLRQREIEQLSKLALHEALQCELETLKQVKEELECALSKFTAAEKGENILKRISTLETELAEALESNVMYKLQLQRAFAKQQNVHAAALESLGSVDKVIKDLADLKRKNLALEDELCHMKKRYFSMSLQFAEVEVAREKLVMTIRNLRGTKRLAHMRSAIF